MLIAKAAKARRARGSKRPAIVPVVSSRRTTIIPVLVATATLALSFGLAQGGPQGGMPGGAPGGAPNFQQAPGGFGGPGSSDRLEIVERFDTDGSGFLDADERSEAKTYLESIGWNAGGRGQGRGPGGNLPGGGFPGGAPGAGGGAGAPAGGATGTTAGTPGVTLTPADVETYEGESFFDTSVVRTIFVETGFDDWESEMASFYNTDVQLPVTVTIDGVTYEDVGMRFRGNSSFSMVSAGLKRPIRIKLDEVVSGQAVEGVRTIKLLNGVNDTSFIRTLLVSTIMQDYIAAPRANYVRLVVNGENWGLYQNQQHYNTDFLRDHYGESGGVRWEVPGSPNGRGGMEYLGDDPDSYRDIYEIDNRDTEASWAALIELFRVLDQTPSEQLVEALEPILDIEETLCFLALDVVVANSDGFWTRASDYEIYLDESGRFHVIPHDLNEALGAGGGGGGRGGFGGAGGGNATLDPLVGLTDTTKPLRSKLLAVPELRKRYLEIVLDITERWMDWDVLGPIAEELHELIADDVEIDTRKLITNDQFQASLDGGTGTLRSFVEQRGAYLAGAVPALIDAIAVDAYSAPVAAVETAVTEESATAGESATAAQFEIADSTAYAQHEGPEGWHVTAGSGSVVTFADADPASPAAAFTFDALSEGFGDNKLDQCVAIDPTRDLTIAYQVLAVAATADARGLAVRVNPNFHGSLASCEAAMANDSGADRLSGGRGDDDIDFVLGADGGGQWLEVDETVLPELRFAATDIPERAEYLRLSLRARDRSDSEGSAALYLGEISVTQAGSNNELLVNGGFALP